jgi:alkylation response protein AidB-like acyl-CoA dehydrogenase
MDIELTDDQQLFHETTVRFIESELPITRVRELHDDPIGFDRSWLRASAELGWYAMLVPEADGGGTISGEGLVDATIVAEELGRHVQPGPFLPMNVVAAAVAEHGTPEQRAEILSPLAAGELVVTWAVAAGDGSWDVGRGLRVERTSAELTLQGGRGFVQDARAADWFLVAGTLDGRTVQVLVPADAPGLTVTPLVGLDLSRRLAEVSFDSVVVPEAALVGQVGAEDAVERQLQVALVLLCAETVGVIDAMFTTTVEYSKDRTAFGRPIGSFQALKHIMADLALYVETCKAAAVAAADAVQRRAPDAAEVVSMAAAYIGDIATDVAQESLQIHGGIGYTWEHDLHLFMRRARTNSVLYGEPGWHRERVCAYHGL